MHLNSPKIAASNLARPNKIVSAAEAVRLIHDGDTIATSGFVGIGFAEGIAVALEERFLAAQAETGRRAARPDAGLRRRAGRRQGARAQPLRPRRARQACRRRPLGPGAQALAVAGEIEAYNPPQGVISHLFRDIAAGKPGTITRVGLGTFVDPRHGGGKINARTTEELVRLMPIDGEDYLFYKRLPDPGRHHPRDDGRRRRQPDDGAREALTLESLAIAMAAHNSGGIVIAQVERLAERGSLNPRQVKIPGVLVDCVVLAEKAEHHHADLRHAVQRGLRRRDPRAAEHARCRWRWASAR